MTTFDWHISRRLLMGFIWLVLILIVFFIALHYVEYMDDFFDRGATLKQVFFVYYPSYIPEIIHLISPLALFLATVFLTARLAQQLQLAVLMTSGVSLYRLLIPYAVIGIGVTAVMFWFNGWVVPDANRTRIDYEYQYFKTRTGRDVSNLYLQNSPGSILSAGHFDRRRNTAYVVSLQSFDDAYRMVERTDAESMTWIDSTRAWRLTGSETRQFNEDGMIGQTERLTRDTTLTLLPRDLARAERDVELLSIPAARQYIESLRRSGVPKIGRPLVSYYSKFTYPFANLILVLLGVPMAAVRRRGGQAMHVGIGLVVAFLYLSIIKLSEPFGYAEAVAPQVVAVFPHMLFLIAAALLISRART